MKSFNRGIFALLAGWHRAQRLINAPNSPEPRWHQTRPNPAGTKLARKAEKGSLGIAVIR